MSEIWRQFDCALSPNELPDASPFRRQLLSNRHTYIPGSAVAPPFSNDLLGASLASAGDRHSQSSASFRLRIELIPNPTDLVVHHVTTFRVRVVERQISKKSSLRVSSLMHEIPK
jgi:hypothetical protein